MLWLRCVPHYTHRIKSPHIFCHPSFDMIKINLDGMSWNFTTNRIKNQSLIFFSLIDFGSCYSWLWRERKNRLCSFAELVLREAIKPIFDRGNSLSFELICSQTTITTWSEWWQFFLGKMRRRLRIYVSKRQRNLFFGTARALLDAAANLDEINQLNSDIYYLLLPP